MSERQPGWYWAMHAAFDEPQVVQYCPSDGFMIAGISGAFDEDAFESIGDRIPAPDEPWQTVPVELIDWIRGAQRLMRALPDGGGWPAAADQADMLLAAAPKPGGE